MTPEEIAAKEAAAKAEAEAKAKAEADAQALQNDAIKKELEKSQQRKAYSDKERAEYNLKKQAEKIKELGGDPAEILGVKANEGTADDTIVPAWYRAEKAKEAEKTSSQLADELSDPDERALTKDYLANRIRSQGDPQDDFRLALSAVRALKNKEILEDVERRTAPRRVAAGGSGNAKVETTFTPTKQEAIFMKPPYSLTQAQIEAARKKAEESQK